MTSSGGSVFGYIKQHFFFITIMTLLLLLLGASYVRFIVLTDYLVTFEGECDPYTESCFEGCEDDECTEVYYYNLIERHATELYERCGSDVLECDEAFECQKDVNICNITFCDPEVDGEDVCIRLTEETS